MILKEQETFYYKLINNNTKDVINVNFGYADSKEDWLKDHKDTRTTSYELISKEEYETLTK